MYQMKAHNPRKVQIISLLQLDKREKFAYFFDKLPSLRKEHLSRPIHCHNTHTVHTMKLLFYLSRIAVNVNYLVLCTLDVNKNKINIVLLIT